MTAVRIQEMLNLWRFQNVPQVFFIFSPVNTIRKFVYANLFIMINFTSQIIFFQQFSCKKAETPLHIITFLRASSPDVYKRQGQTLLFPSQAIPRKEFPPIQRGCDSLPRFPHVWNHSLFRQLTAVLILFFAAHLQPVLVLLFRGQAAPDVTL